MNPDPIQETAEWRRLEAHQEAIGALHMRRLFDEDRDRFERFSIEACGLFLDYSKNRITTETVERLSALAERAHLPDWTERLFSGEEVNRTEHRAALHMALRDGSGKPFPTPGNDVMAGVRAVLEKVRRFSDAVRSGAWRGYAGHRIRSVVNIGIGGSDLGPAMVTRALDGFRDSDLTPHFVSNLDSTQLVSLLEGLRPETTLFIVASKTFGTQETLTNAASARRWLVNALRDERAVARHFVAVSTHRDRVADFGIDPENMFEFWDWVGGRYSLWSAIGLSIAVAVGFDHFQALLRGGHAMDRHFRGTPATRNMPVVLGLLDVWYRNFFHTSTHAVLPYDYALRDLPDHLQQLLMESNGKRVARDGTPLPFGTCPVVWGGAGSNGQHAFYQLLHQGTLLVPADFIVPVHLQRPEPGHEAAVIANALAQTEALMRGRTEAEARAELAAAGMAPDQVAAEAPHRVLPGNQPTNTIVYDRLTPEVLGALIALYEHRTFVQSVCWGNNPFDQWGVELGKQLAGVILSDLAGDAVGSAHDGSTAGLIRRIRARRGG